MIDTNRPLFGDDDAGRGSYDTTSDSNNDSTFSGAGSSASGQMEQQSQMYQGGVASAVFDSHDEAQQAVTALRQAGASDSD